MTIVALAAASVARAATPERAPPAAEASPPIEQLIAELGSDEFAVRRRAEEQLLRMGPEAFDALKAAEQDRDLEIAERVKYIAQRIRVEWIRPDDGPEVRRALARYADLAESEKRQRLRQLARVPRGGGLAALCRIARFDPAPQIARRAALAAMDEISPKADDAAQRAACGVELGRSQRTPAAWIRLRLRELESPGDAIEAWQTAVEAEAALVAGGSDETSFSIARTLVDQQLERRLAAGRPEGLLSALNAAITLIEREVERAHDPAYLRESTEEIVELIDWGADYREQDARAAALAWSLEWIIRRQAWDVLPAWQNAHGESAQRHRKLLYFLAAATARAGGSEPAEQLAERAYALVAGDDDERIDQAGAVAELGFVAWAEREYRRAIEKFPVLDLHSMEARTSLAMWLHDREDFAGAARLLTDFHDALQADRAGQQRLVARLERRQSGKALIAGLEGRRYFYLACAAEAAGKYDEQRGHLEAAAAISDNDPDVLIAMFRLRGADDDYHELVRRRIRQSSAAQLRVLTENDDNPTLYNQWAWLIANTEGDQARAVEFSKRSLELSPDEPSYLDTLGRCYFAVGELEKAVETQRRAVELAPHYQVMRRQLRQFEQALAARDSQETEQP